MKQAKLWYVLVCLLALGAQPAHALPGDLDAGFGSGGFAFSSFSDFGFGFSSASGIAIQGDGKIVVVGSARTSGTDFTNTSIVLARFNVDGTPDTTFGISGRMLTGFDASNNFGAAVTIQPDGKIVVAGSAATSSSGSAPVSLGVARYATNGALDTTFGVGGKTTTSIGAGGTVGAMRIQGDGRILVAGSVVRSGTGRDFLLVRFRSSGALDTSFGATGLVNLSGAVTTDFGGQERATALAIQGDGAILVAGVNQVGADSRFAIVRYGSNGLIDSTFGSNGRVLTNFVANDHGGSSGDAAFALAVQGNGRIVAAGRAETDTALARTDVALARYNSNGTLDTTFGTGGRVTTAFVAGDPQRANEAAFAVVIQPDGRIVVGGFTGVPFSEVFALARYNDNGSLDTAFGSGGKVATDRRGHLAFAMAIQLFLLDGRIVVAGEGAPVGVSGSSRIALARFQAFTRTLTPIGSFDLGPSEATADVHEPLRYAFTWTVPEPLNWHDLQSLQLRIRDGADIVLWLRFDEATNTFSLFKEAAGRFGRGVAPGTPESLETREARLDLAETTVVGTGPTGPSVTLNLALSFKPSAAGRVFTVEVAASDDEGNEDAFTDAGTVSVRR